MDVLNDHVFDAADESETLPTDDSGGADAD